MENLFSTYEHGASTAAATKYGIVRVKRATEMDGSRNKAITAIRKSAMP